MAETRSKADFVTTLRAVQSSAPLSAYHRDTIIAALQCVIEDVAVEKADAFYSAAVLVKLDELCDLLRDLRKAARHLDPGAVYEAFVLRPNRPQKSERETADALADGIESGDLDADGNAIPYDRYP